MKQKFFTIFLALAASAGTIFAQSGTCGENLTWNLTNGVLTISGTGDMTNWKYECPWHSYLSSITTVTIGNSVTSIGSSAFSYCTGLTSITIPNSVTSIGDRAFSGCTGLTSITIPNSVTSIGWSAFYGCTGQTSVVVENGNTVYDSRENCNAIIETSTNTLIFGCKNTIIPNSVTSIGEAAFYGCTDLTSITIPNSVTSIGNWAFGGCTNLTSPVFNEHVFAYMPTTYSGVYSIPDGIESIAGYAFNSCTGLTSITIPNSVTSIGDYAFYYCTGLTSVTIPNSVTSIGTAAFYNCTGLTSITIPNSVTSIGSSAFYYCTGLTSITIPNSVTSIGDDAFYNCTGLTSITIPNSVTSIGSSAFYYCSGLTSVTIPNSVISIGGNAFYGCQNLTNITIPDGVQSIGNCAFDACSGLTNVFIPKSVTTIGKNAFDGSNYMAIDVAPDSPNYCSVDGVLFNKDKSILIKYPGGKHGNYVVPNSVTRIEESAFFRCLLTNLTIHNNVTSIGKINFDACYDLTSIICESVTPPQCDGYLILSADGTSASLFVPAESVNAYKTAVGWEEFGDLIQPIQASSAQVTSLTAVPTDNSVEIAWLKVANSDKYELIIKKNGVIFCTLIFNAQGQLINIAFAAPTMRNEKAEAQSAGFRYTITGLEAGTAYDVIINAKNAVGTIINSVNKSFVTLAPTGLEEIINNQSQFTNQKLLHDGQILILRDGKVFDLTGRKF